MQIEDLEKNIEIRCKKSMVLLDTNRTISKKFKLYYLEPSKYPHMYNFSNFGGFPEVVRLYANELKHFETQVDRRKRVIKEICQ